VTTSGEPPSGAGGVSEPDWIDQILERASKEVDAQPSRRPAVQRREPIVPEPAPQEPPKRSAAETLADIEWVERTDVTPASTPIVSPAGSPPAAEPVGAVPQRAPVQDTPTFRTQQHTELVPEAVGRSAWADELASVGDQDPEGWDKLSWQDLDQGGSSTSPTMQEPTSFGRLLREWGPVLFAAVVIALFTRLVLVQAYHIPSGSMIPTLEQGDRVVVNRLSYQFGEIDRGQVVVFAKPQGTEGENDLIKRIIGMPGETIRFVDNKVFINGLRVEEPYLFQQESTRPRLMIPGCAQEQQASDLCVIPDGHVFMMGDNRVGSADSRVFGPVPVDSIVGRAFLRVWPLNSLGQL